MQSHQNMPCARLIKQAAGLLRTRFVPDDTRWRDARPPSQPAGLDRSLYMLFLYASTTIDGILCAATARQTSLPQSLYS
jgi:hypothetical protein